MLNYFNDDDIRTQLLDFMRSLNLEPAAYEPFILDGDIHRYSTKDDRHGKTSGAYCIHTDGIPAGWVQDWRKGEAVKWCFDTRGCPDDVRDYFKSQDFKREADELKRKNDEVRAKKHSEATELARVTWEQLQTPKPDCTYLKAKRVYNYGLRFNPASNALAVPLRDISGKLLSLQWILPDGSKRYFPNAPLDGAFFSIALDTIKDNPNVPILIGEGYATMAKIYELTGYPCVAAKDCGSLASISNIIHQAFPDNNIFITADDDKNTELRLGYNPGLRDANAVVKRGVAKAVISPPFKSPDDGTDWDDFAILYGDDRTQKLLLQLIRWECMTNDEQEEFLARRKLAEMAIELDKNIQIPPEDFIGGIFPRKRISAVIAPPGTGKTWFLQRNVSDLSVGGSIFDGFADEDFPHKCLVFAGKAGTDLMIRRATETNWPVNKHNVKMYGMIEMEKKGISIMLDEDEGRMNIERIIDIHHPDIVFFDTLSSFHNSDENKSQEMKPIFRWLLTLADRHNIAVVLMHHSRKRLAKERRLALNQDDAIGSSIFNRLISVIISIEPTEDDNKTLMVKVLKSWFQEFMPFTYKLTEGENERTVMKIDLAPEGISNAKTELWDYLRRTYAPDEWFKASDLRQALKDIMPLRTIQRYLASLVANKKLKRRGEGRSIEYSLIGFYSKE